MWVLTSCSVGAYGRTRKNVKTSSIVVWAIIAIFNMVLYMQYYNGLACSIASVWVSAAYARCVQHALAPCVYLTFIMFEWSKLCEYPLLAFLPVSCGCRQSDSNVCICSLWSRVLGLTTFSLSSQATTSYTIEPSLHPLDIPNLEMLSLFQGCMYMHLYIKIIYAALLFLDNSQWPWFKQGSHFKSLCRGI